MSEVTAVPTSDHTIVLCKRNLKLKFKEKNNAHKNLKPHAVEKLKNDTSSALYQTELSNRFQQLQQATDIEEQWSLFKQAVRESADVTVGLRRGTQREQWREVLGQAYMDINRSAKSSKTWTSAGKNTKKHAQRKKKLQLDTEN